MGSVATLDREAAAPTAPGIGGRVMNAVGSALQLWAGLTTYLVIAWALNRFCRPRKDGEPDDPARRLARSVALFALSMALNGAFFAAVLAGFKLAPPAVIVPDLALFVLALVKLRSVPDY